MKIAIIGSGKMGASLGKIRSKANYEVFFSYSKDSQKPAELAREAGSKDRSETISEAVANSEIVMIAVWFPSLDEVLREANLFAGKTVITCVSGLQPDFSGATIGIATDLKISIAEYIQAQIPEASVVEAFNSTFAEILAAETRDFKGEQPSVFYCGDNAEAKSTVKNLIADCGFEAVDAGNLIAARSLETLATAWVQFAAASRLFPNIGLKALRR